MAIPQTLAATQQQIVKAGVICLDCRGQAELEADPKVDGALHVWCPGGNTELVDKVIEEGLIPADKGTPIVAYCAVGDRSGRCLQRLAVLGYTDLVNGVNVQQMREALG